MTFEEIKAIVFSFQKSRDDTVQEATITAAVNTAINQILRESELAAIQYDPPTATMVVGQDAYTINGSVFKILTMEIVDNGLRSGVPWMDWREYKENRFGTQTNGKPQFWTVWEGKIRFWPAPDRAYTFNYPSLRKSGSLDAIDEEFRDVVLNGALAFFDPKYIGVFEKGKNELYAYWEKERANSNDWTNDPDVEAHYVSRSEVNII